MNLGSRTPDLGSRLSGLGSRIPNLRFCSVYAQRILQITHNVHHITTNPTCYRYRSGRLALAAFPWHRATRAYCLSSPRGDSPVPPFFGSGGSPLSPPFDSGRLALTAFLWLGAAPPCSISLAWGGSHTPPPFGSGRLAHTAFLWLGATCP